MVIEIAIILPLFILYMLNYIPGYIPALSVTLLYWIPKCIFINLIEYLYPEVKTRNVKGQKISLTFDDVPYGSEEEIVNILNKYNMKSTLFVISSEINSVSREVLIKAVKEGHELGNHGKTNSMHYLKSNSRLEEEIQHCDKTINEIYRLAGIKRPEKKYYRPGCGLFGKEMIKVATELGYELVLGSVYPNDPVVRSSTINYYYLIYN